MRHASKAVRVATLLLAFTATGCGIAFSYLRLPHDERRLFDIYSVGMTPTQQAEYLARPSAASRAAYAESLGLRQKFLALPEGEQEAVLAQRLMRGMSAQALLMSWGHPWDRRHLEGGYEEWLYYPGVTRHLPPSVGYRVYLRASRVREWVQFVVPVPERGLSRLLIGPRRRG